MLGTRAYLCRVQPPARQIPGILKSICFNACCCFFSWPLCSRRQTLYLLG